jgi:hypothetical protein
VPNPEKRDRETRSEILSREDPGADTGGIGARVLSLLGEAVGATEPVTEEVFTEIALSLFREQVEKGSFYGEFCRRTGVDPPAVRHWRDVPAVPVSAFKETAIATFPAGEAAIVFHSSGTTLGRPARHYLRTPVYYESAVLAAFRRHVLPPGEKAEILVLFPSPRVLPRSSLGHMLELVARRLSSSPPRFLLEEGRIESEVLVERCRGGGEVPLCLLGTFLSFARLLEDLEARDLRLELPPGSRAMETGGSKGEVGGPSREDLLARIEERLGLARNRMVGEYGMTELGSQFYEDPERRVEGPGVRFVPPPWVRTRVVDPVDGSDRDDGPGILVHYDPVNVDSVLAVQTDDLGRALPDGSFELLGRVPGAEARGCSHAVSELLASAAARDRETR